jgi:hypothetical protein
MARSATVMRKLLLILGVLSCCTGCAAREPQLYKVVDSTDLQPVGGAEVWMQPWAPIHPFWPAGDRGTTDANGEVTLSLPHGFWFYFWGVKADGYTEVKDPDLHRVLRVRPVSMRPEMRRTGLPHHPPPHWSAAAEQLPYCGGRLCGRGQ